MPTKKQRRRRAKEQRHEYEVVWVDGEGNELEESPEEPGPSKSTKASKSSGSSSKGGRTLQPPSWHRSARRSLMFAPFFFAVLVLIQRNIYGALIVTAFYTAVFVPFTYALDSYAYKRQNRR